MTVLQHNPSASLSSKFNHLFSYRTLTLAQRYRLHSCGHTCQTKDGIITILNQLSTKGLVLVNCWRRTNFSVCCSYYTRNMEQAKVLLRKKPCISSLFLSLDVKITVWQSKMNHLMYFKATQKRIFLTTKNKLHAKCTYYSRHHFHQPIFAELKSPDILMHLLRVRTDRSAFVLVLPV